ncbi:hypothetical protein AMTR_s00001p00264190 [Amborella trichopoda]|uniref:Uncharacterized protein n=1 Tax=Amborella trichopoda TaxID=13333 RepID=W1NMM1_AMBTC|nr:hypothetical protein AMTR_s00001p00264190 [Amborella trichopoda]
MSMFFTFLPQDEVLLIFLLASGVSYPLLLPDKIYSSRIVNYYIFPVTLCGNEVATDAAGIWYVTFIIVCSLGAIAGAVIVAKKYYKKPESMAPKFQQLAQVQIQGFLDDDDEEEENDCLNPQVPRNDKSHL